MYGLLAYKYLNSNSVILLFIDVTGTAVSVITLELVVIGSNNMSSEIFSYIGVASLYDTFKLSDWSILISSERVFVRLI